MYTHMYMYSTCTAHVYHMYMYASKEDIIGSLSTGTQSSIAIKDVLNVKCYKVQANYHKKYYKHPRPFQDLKGDRERERETRKEREREGRQSLGHNNIKIYKITSPLIAIKPHIRMHRHTQMPRKWKATLGMT